ncbi:MAG: uroporphyrinogen decarboxylase family protein [Chloroflexota bacterium]|nr:uroporphyrinogen decarboxylase family protein [Chloroflexota bacterium]
MTATNRERMRATLAGERLDYIPSWVIGFNSEADARRLVPAELVPADLYYVSADGTYGFAAHEPAELDTVIAYNRYIDQVATGVGRGANFCFGHAGPGEFNSRVVERTADGCVIEYETGARDRQNFSPQFKHQLSRPVQTIDDVDRLALPDPDDPSRWEGFAADVARLKAAGEYTVGWVNGFFSGGHYFFCDYQDFLAALLLEPELVDRLLARLGDWNLRAARHMLEAGVDCIGFCDDLGSSANLLMSPTLYRRFFLPWHTALADVVHHTGGVLHMHSHGNINSILDDVVGAGIDMLNPLDGTDGMDLVDIRQRYPRLTLVGGGIDKFLYGRPLDEIAAGLRRSAELCGRQGRLAFMDPGGIPEDIDTERYLAIRQISRRERGQPEE